jgi:hypothetical protein
MMISRRPRINEFSGNCLPQQIQKSNARKVSPGQEIMIDRAAPNHFVVF